MNELQRKTSTITSGEKDIIFTKIIKAGKRIYYLDVKQNLKKELFFTITESKKIPSRDGSTFTLEKHKIFLYKEDFDSFLEGITEIISFIKEHNFRAEIADDDYTPEELSELIKIEDIDIQLD